MNADRGDAVSAWTSTRSIITWLLVLPVLAAAGVMNGIELFVPAGALVLSIAACATAAFTGLFTRRFAAVRLFGLLGAVSLVAMAMDLALLDRQRLATERTAGDVIAAVERYRARHGAPPASLDQLVPEQLAEVPRARGGRPFSYAAEAGEFRLGFPIPMMLMRTYDSRTGRWSTRDGSP